MAASTSVAAAATQRGRFIDIGANLLDGMFQGVYHTRQHHDPDVEDVLERAWTTGVERIVVTATGLTEAKLALDWVMPRERLYTTVGVHPTQTGDFDRHSDGSEAYLEELLELARRGKESKKVVAIGEVRH